MENRPRKSHGVEIPKKSRSLDLKSLYRNMDSKKESGSKRKVGVGSDEKRPERKKSRKEVSITSFKLVSRNGSKSLEEVYNGCLSSSLHDCKDTLSGSSWAVNGTSVLSSIVSAFSDNVVNVPRRKRGFVGRRRVENSSQVAELGGEVGDVDLVGRLTDGNVAERVKIQKVEEGVKEHGNGELNSHGPSLEEDTCASDSAAKCGDSSVKDLTVRGGDLSVKDSCHGNSVANNVDSPFTGSFRKRSRKRKKVTPANESIVTETEPAIHTSFRADDDLREDDEENLEENAARMLSSRFDPSCTGFPNSNASALSSPTRNGLSAKLYGGRKFVTHSSGFNSPSRILRPRKQHMEGSSKVRRNYYRIYSANLDAHWVLNQRIKVFWPLDKSWYYGHVTDYDREKKLHHIKYDDRDEEWIDLQNERFKLLLLPSEVPGGTQRKRYGTGGKHVDGESGKVNPVKGKKGVWSTTGNGHTGNHMDSEPIISWLPRSAHKVKTSPGHVLKKKNTPDLSPVSALSTPEAAGKHKGLDGVFLSHDEREPCTNKCTLGAVRRKKVFSVETTDCAANKKLLVYYRRRFRKTRGVLCHKAEVTTHMSIGILESDSYFPVSASGDAGEKGQFLRKWYPSGDLEKLEALDTFWVTNCAGLLILNVPLIASRNFRFRLSLPMASILSCSFGRKDTWLFRTSALLRTGVLTSLWPRVHLEMLFVNNTVGLRFALFEGSLKQVVAFVFTILTAFNSSELEKCSDLSSPVTSIRFKLSSILDCRKQLVFAFCNFSDVKDLMWMYLDRKLKRHCLISWQLPLSECTYDNVKALRNGSYPLFSSSFCEDPSSIKGPQRSSKEGSSSVINIVRETICANAIQSSEFDENCKSVPLFGLSFTAVPTFFLGLHLKLLMERSVTNVIFQNDDSTENPEMAFNLQAEYLATAVDNCSNVGQITSLDGSVSCQKFVPEVGVGISADQMKASSTCQNDGENVRTSASNGYSAALGTVVVTSPKQSHHHVGSKQADLLHCPLVHSDNAPNFQDNIDVDIPSSDQFDKQTDKETHSALQISDISWSMNGGIIPSSNPTARRSTWNRNRSSSGSFGYCSHGWSDVKADFLQNNFVSGPKRPRTQVSYTLPFGRFDYGSKNKSHHSKGLPHKRIRTPNERRLQDTSKGFERNLELLSCDVNVLVTRGDRGWRECGAQVVLELFDHNEWKLAVKVSGVTKYSHKAHQFLHPGSTNRYTHAMMWKGGKDWVLEFLDRRKWFLFKEMHEECYNRNLRAASVKNIPIPGVRFVEENDDNGPEEPFIRGSKYFHQVETDVEMALDASRVLYDMDSEDEQWMMQNRNSPLAENEHPLEVSEDMFEKIMDMFEKAAYTQQRDQFTSDEIKDFMAGVGPIEAVNIIYEYWWQKRQGKEMPLIRHLQPPLWEWYQQQVREWELVMTTNNTFLPNGRHEKGAFTEKPPMFAFCMKPRGLDVPNKGSKHRSHRKFSVGQSNSFTGDHDGFHANGRRLNGFGFVDERYTYESFDDSPLPQVSPRVFSPQDAALTGFFSVNSDRQEKNLPKLQRSKSKKLGTLVSVNDAPMGTSYGQRVSDQRNGFHWSNMDCSDWPSQRHYYLNGLSKHIPEQLDGSDVDELMFRDASGAAQYAVNLARLKRERAQRLLYRADLAIHRAMVALMTAEAIKASSEDVNSDG